MYRPHLIHSSAGGYLGCFHPLATVDGAAVHTLPRRLEHLSLMIWGIQLGVELLGRRDNTSVRRAGLGLKQRAQAAGLVFGFAFVFLRERWSSQTAEWRELGARPTMLRELFSAEASVCSAHRPRHGIPRIPGRASTPRCLAKLRLETWKLEGGDYKVSGKAAAALPTRRAGEVQTERHVVSRFTVLCHGLGNVSGI